VTDSIDRFFGGEGKEKVLEKSALILFDGLGRLRDLPSFA
jgi:hypothetical protein